MARISSYPVVTPKEIDTLIISQGYDIDADEPIEDNPTGSVTIGSVIDLINTGLTPGTGTVTSLGVSMPSAFTVSNSPVTSTGVINITGSGTSTQYIDGTGSLQLSPNQSLNTTDNVVFNSIAGDGALVTNIDKYTTSYIDSNIYTKTEADGLFSSGFVGAISPTSSAPTQNGLYSCTQSGTYTNFGGEVVSLSNQVVSIAVEGTQNNVFSQIITPTGIIFDSTPTSGSTNAVESGGTYDALDYSNDKIDVLYSQSKIEKESTLLTGLLDGFYNEEGSFISSVYFKCTENPINLVGKSGIFYTGEFGSVSGYAVIFLDSNLDIISTVKLGDESNNKVIYDSLFIEKPTGATSVLISFFTSNSISYSIDLQINYLYDFFVEKTELNISLESGFYNNSGDKSISSSWFRTVQKYELTSDLDKYELKVVLAGSNASLIFYDSSGVFLGYETSDSLSLPSGSNSLVISDISPVNTKFINISSFLSAPKLYFLQKKYNIAKDSDFQIEKEKVSVLEGIIEGQPVDYYNNGSSLAQNINTSNKNTSPFLIDKIPNASYSWWNFPTSMYLTDTDFTGLGKSLSNIVSYAHSFGDNFLARIFNNSTFENQVNVENKCVSVTEKFAADEHNVAAFTPLSNGSLMVVNSGRYESKNVYVRILENFNQNVSPIVLETQGNTTYQQIYTYNETIMIFVRDAQYRWSYFYSKNNGETWSDCKTFLLGSSGERAYMRGICSELGYLKIYWYPSADERANTFVRYCEVNLDTGDVLTKQNGTNLGNVFSVTNLDIPLLTGGLKIFDNTGIADTVSSGNRRLRLLDVSGNSRNEAVFLVSTIEGEKVDLNTGDYRLIVVDLSNMSITSTYIADFGKEFEINSDYMQGAYFEQSIYGVRTGNIYLGRFGTSNLSYDSNDVDNKYRIEKFNGFTISELVEESDTLMYRPLPPLYINTPSLSYKVNLTYMKGDYDGFTNFFTDLKIIT